MKLLLIIFVLSLSFSFNFKEYNALLKDVPELPNYEIRRDLFVFVRANESISLMDFKGENIVLEKSDVKKLLEILKEIYEE